MGSGSKSQHVGLGEHGRKLYQAFDEVKSMEDWLADPRCKVSYHGLRKRLARGEIFEQALSALPLGTWTIFGETKTKSEWLKDPRCAASEAAIDQRLHHGMSYEEALTKPSPDFLGPRLAFGEWKTLPEWRRDPRCVVPRGTLLSRLQLGWDLEPALTKSVRKISRDAERGRILDTPVPASDNAAFEAFGEKLALTDWARDPRCAVTLSRLRQRLRTGWNMEAALTTSPKEVTLLEAFGESKTVAEWASDPRCAVRFATLHTRIAKGVPPLEAITTPAAKRSAPWKIHAFGEIKSLQGWARDPRCVVSARGLQSRLDGGEPPEDAITRPAEASGPRRRRPAQGFF